MNATTNGLPPFEQVFFVHYQCDFFEEGTRIFDLHIYAHGKLKGYSGKDEKVFLKNYANRVNELMAEGLIPVHWNQNRPHYGPDHINARYEELTGSELKLDYINDINLAEKLKEIYGDDYITDNHSRLDRLAELNGFHGSLAVKDVALHVLHSSRTLLLYRIYCRVLTNKLVTDKNKHTGELNQTDVKIKTPAVTDKKDFSNFLLYADKQALADEIKKEFQKEKGKMMRFLIEALQLTDPPMLTYCKGDGKKLYNAMKEFFNHNIGAYNSIFGYDYLPSHDKKNIDAMLLRLKFIEKNISRKNPQS